jgi:hypothetical protein
MIKIRKNDKLQEKTGKKKEVILRTYINSWIMILKGNPIMNSTIPTI